MAVYTQVNISNSLLYILQGMYVGDSHLKIYLDSHTIVHMHCVRH